MKYKAILLGLALAATLGASAAKPLVIAHRGYWDTEGSAQNSIRALAKADSIGCHASEFDVWITADGTLVVNHDPHINNVVIETSPACDVLAQTLANGEHVPTLESYLREATGHPGMKLILELKPHVSNAREKAAIEGILAMVKKYNLEDRTEYITFSRNGFADLCRKAPKGTPVYYLNGDYVPSQILFAKGAGIDYSLKAMKKHPEWVKECHDLGLKVNVWTVNKPEDMQWCIDQGVDFITTNDPEGLQRLLKK